MSVRASELAAFIGSTLHGADVDIHSVKPLHEIEEGCFTLATNFDDSTLDRLNAFHDICVLAGDDYGGKLQVPHFLSSHPRRHLARILGEFFAPPQQQGIAPTAIVSDSAELGDGVSIGHYCVIGDDVVIGDNTEIRHHVFIGHGCRIGANCLVKTRAIIGESGFAFDFDEEGRPLHIPHVGTVVIGNHVEIGACTTVVRGTLGETRIDDHVKLDDHVHFGHNVHAGENSIITACTLIGGSVEIGKDTWLGPNSSIRDWTHIEERGFVGLGSVVIKRVEANTVVVGNPARPLRKRFDN